MHKSKGRGGGGGGGDSLSKGQVRNGSSLF